MKVWLEAREGLAMLRRDYSAQELRELTRTIGVDRTVVIQAADNVADTAFMARQAEQEDFIGGIVGWLPLEDPRATERQLELYAGNPKIKGFRHMIIWESDPDWLVRANVLESLGLVAERGYSWDSTATISRHLEHVSTLSERHPNLLHVIDHLGKPAASESLWEPWAALMMRAAEHPNVYVKLSGLNNPATLKAASPEQFRPYVEFVLEHFGPQRVMIASNWPVSLLAADYATTWRGLVSLIDHLGEAERAAILGGTATRFYRLV